MNKYTKEEISRLENIEKLMFDLSGIRAKSPFASLRDVLHDQVLDMIEEVLKPAELETFADLTKAEWQRVLDEGYDVAHPAYNRWHKLDNLNNLKTFSTENIKVRREIGHIQPYFPRLGKPDIPDDATIVYYTDEGRNNHVMHMLSIECWDQIGNIREIDSFIQLTEGTKNA